MNGHNLSTSSTTSAGDACSVGPDLHHAATTDGIGEVVGEVLLVLMGLPLGWLLLFPSSLPGLP